MILANRASTGSLRLTGNREQLSSNQHRKWKTGTNHQSLDELA